MRTDINLPPGLQGLSEAEVKTAREQYGRNALNHRRNTWLKIILDILQEPMLILLISIVIIYVALGQMDEAYFMLAAIVIVSGISIFQNRRSQRALKALQQMSAPLSRVIRDGDVQQIPTAEIVPGDLVMTDEGSTINADGEIVFSHDFSVNESILTGEAQPVFKSTETTDRQVFSGTSASSGLAVYRVDQIGDKTRIGQLGLTLEDIREEKSPLEIQINTFVRWMTGVGIVVFLLVWAVQFSINHDILESLLKGLTLAMAILPEEIPVAFAVFLAMGAMRLMREGVIVKKIKSVETLGSATVICADKTGTITENRMSLEGVYVFRTRRFHELKSQRDPEPAEVIRYAMWASEPIPFDPMEKTLHESYARLHPDDERRRFNMVHEYPLGGTPPMMTHIHADTNGHRIIAAKGAPEAMLRVSQLSPDDLGEINRVIDELANKGFRLLGIGRSLFAGNDFPETQQELPFEFLGIVAFYDPPKKNIQEVVRRFYEAGLDVKIITGDNALTTRNIALQAGIHHAEAPYDGTSFMQLSPAAMQDIAKTRTLFTRMYPEAKLKVVEQLKAMDQVVAVVGDGVNDGPALKAAHIGIAMGQRGTELAKQAAALILRHDDLAGLVTAIASGRRIYTNLKKAIQYIISIHIPILLIVSLPLFLGWIYPDIFTPVHVIFLELLMGPTCSIVYENEPMEKNAMQQPPRALTNTFLNWKEMGLSVIQGLVITMGTLLMYQLAVRNGATEEVTRTMVFTTLILANILLTLVNRSFYFSILVTMRYQNRLLRFIILLTLGMLAGMLYIDPVRNFFHLGEISLRQVGWCTLMAFFSVIWIEGYKWWKRVHGPGVKIKETVIHQA